MFGYGRIRQLLRWGTRPAGEGLLNTWIPIKLERSDVEAWVEASEAVLYDIKLVNGEDCSISVYLCSIST